MHFDTWALLGLAAAVIMGFVRWLNDADLRLILKGLEKIMAATDDLKAGQAAIDKAVGDVATYLKNLATTMAGGVSAEDAEAVAADLNTQAAALEAAITPVVPVPPAPAS